jgi:phosphoribosylformimino-5-aminoimidazole carboxamide ribotide isomerase
LKIIPVLDVLDGVTVHAVAGRRDQYSPIRSYLCNGADPLEVVAAFRSVYKFKDLYVADLDAILGKKSTLSLLHSLNELRFRVMVDSGVRSIDQVLKLIDAGAFEVIVGTETMPNISLVEKIIDAVGQNRIVISVDTKDGKILGNSKSIRSLHPLDFINKLEGKGLSKFILLDLTRVGTVKGPDLKFIREILKMFDGEFIVGGGVRDINDLKQLRNLGVYGVLLATALHTKRISKSELEIEGFI